MDLTVKWEEMRELNMNICFRHSQGTGEKNLNIVWSQTTGVRMGLTPSSPFSGTHCGISEGNLSALIMISFLFRWSSRDGGFGNGLHICCILETHLVVHWAAQEHITQWCSGGHDKRTRLKLKPWLQHICTTEVPARKHGLIDAVHLLKWHEAPERKHVTPGRVQETPVHLNLPRNVGLSWWPLFSFYWENRSN